MLLALVGALALGEWFGWPFLATPLQHLLSQSLNRRVQFAGDVRFRFVGSVRLQAAQLELAAPAWSAAPHLVLARELDLGLRYVDLWRAARGQRLRIERLHAAWLDAHLERRADGQASWVFAFNPEAASHKLPLIGSLAASTGLLHYNDGLWAIELEARLSRLDQPAADSTGLAAWRLTGSGRVRQLPLQIELQATGALTSSTPMKVNVQASVGRARLDYVGTALDSSSGVGLNGLFVLKGPSLAAVGDLAGVTLPTTAAFQSAGRVVKQGDTWNVVINDATVGSSRLNGAFVYERGRKVALLSGRLGGSRLLLADLGPVVGTTPAITATAAPTLEPTRKPGRVLPDRAFNLPALRAMDANVLVDIGSVDLNTRLLEPLHPLRGHLQLTGGVLTLRELDARTAQGRLTGQLTLDGRGDVALWEADLRWDGLRLERWIHQPRAGAAPPFVSGRLNGRASVRGRGRSTAEILASLTGSARTELLGGAVSHLAIEAAGLDVAQSLGVLVRGDKPLPVNCAVADLTAERGVFRTHVMVVDTPDSTIWIDGTLSLASEALDLRAVVSPKDVSPLALRTPLRVRGSLADPQVSVETGALSRKLASSLLLGLLNPLAALIPLIDPGDTGDAGRGAAACRRLMQATARPGR